MLETIRELELSEEDKASVFGGNASRLMGEGNVSRLV
jgi:hypothetical protein